jgi:glycosyltransferase involved in cell wall biosynthesis
MSEQPARSPDTFRIPPPDGDEHPPVVFLASLAIGGAERIVLDWIAARPRPVRLVLLHDVAHEYHSPANAALIRLGGRNLRAQLTCMAEALCAAGYPYAVLCHLLRTTDLHALWRGGLRTVPVIHNMPQGWQADPAQFAGPHVPLVVAVAERVAAAVRARTALPVLTLRHRRPAPRVAAGARGRIRAELGIEDGARLLVALGSFKPQKRFPLLADLLAHLHAKRPTRLIVAGSADAPAQQTQRARLCMRAAELGVRDRLTLCASLREVGPVLAAADALVNVSAYEGFSMATDEALALGVPCVVSEVGGQAEHADPGISCVPEPFDTLAFAGEVERVLAERRPRTLREGAHVDEWSLPAHLPAHAPASQGVTFVTANLLVGGAQRSLVHLLCGLERHWPLQLWITHPGPDFAPFCAQTSKIRCSVQRAHAADPLQLASTIMQGLAQSRHRTLVFWNADARLKLILCKWLHNHLRVIDVSPGPALFHELTSAAHWQHRIGFDAGQYFAALACLVHKYHAAPEVAHARTTCIPNGVALPPLPAAPPRPDAPRILVLGRFSPDKHLAACAASLPLVCVRYPRARLRFVGEARPADTAYADALRRHYASAQVRFDPAEDGPSALREADLLLVMGTDQGCPNVVLEAMAAGVPVVANADGGTAELLDAGRGGVLLANRSPEAAARGLIAALDDWPETLARRERAYRRLREQHSLPLMVERYRALIAGEV